MLAILFFSTNMLYVSPSPSPEHAGVVTTVSLVLSYTYTAIAISKISEENISIRGRLDYGVYFFLCALSSFPSFVHGAFVIFATMENANFFQKKGK